MGLFDDFLKFIPDPDKIGNAIDSALGQVDNALQSAEEKLAQVGEAIDKAESNADQAAGKLVETVERVEQGAQTATETITDKTDQIDQNLQQLSDKIGGEGTLLQ